MSIIIATGGLDEMAIDVSYVIVSGIFAVVAGLTAFSWWKRSLAAVIAALVLILVDGVLIEPWIFIVSRPSDGPYDQTWQFKMRVISVVWLLLFIVILASLTRVIRHRQVKIDGHNAA